MINEDVLILILVWILITNLLLWISYNAGYYSAERTKIISTHSRNNKVISLFMMLIMSLIALAWVILFLPHYLEIYGTEGETTLSYPEISQTLLYFLLIGIILIAKFQFFKFGYEQYLLNIGAEV